MATGTPSAPSTIAPARASAGRLARPLDGRVVRLEPLEARHEEPLWAAAQDPLVWRYMRVRGDASRDSFAAWFEAALRDHPFAILVGGAPVGSSSYLNVREDDGVTEIGNTWLSSGVWGTGANTESKYLLLGNAFEAGFRRVEFKTEATNERSRAALLKIGATFEGVFRKHMVVRGGERRDSAWYSVVDDEWPAVRAALEQKLRRD